MPDDTPPLPTDKAPVPWLLIVLSLLLLSAHVWLVHRNITQWSPVAVEINHMVRGSEALLGNTNSLGKHPHPYDFVVGLHLLNSSGEHRPVSRHPDEPVGAQLDEVTQQWIHTGIFSSSDSPLLTARWATMLLSVVLGLIVLGVSRQLWGDAGGLLSLAMYCFSPAITAHASLATPDLANAFVLLALVMWTWRSAKRMAKSDTPLGIWPVILLLLVGVMQWAMAGKPQPTALWGGSWYLNGIVSAEHPAYFYLYTFLIKTPIMTLVILGIAQYAWLMRKGQRQHDIQRSWPMVCILLSTLFIAMRVTEPMGLRLLLPVYPALFVLAGSVMLPVSAMQSTQHKAIRATQAFCLLAVCVLGLQAMVFTQDGLAFTNQAAREHDAIFPHLAVDNLDWGQDHRRAAVQADYLASFGPMAEADPQTREISLLQWHDLPLHGGRYVISSNYLAGATPGVLPRDWTQQLESEYQRLRDYFKSGLLNMPKPIGHQHAGALPTLSHEQWMWLRLRLARICAHLRVRQPDNVIGKTMLMYQLSDDQVQYMLNTPPYAQKDHSDIP